MTLGTDLTFLVAVAAGLISFLSPCVLPLVPAYLGQLTAVAVAGSPAGAAPSRWVAVRHAAAYVLGFGTVFTILGISATYAGGALGEWLPLLRQVGGVILIVMGLNLAGFLNIGRLGRTWRPLDLGASTVVAESGGGIVLQDPGRSSPSLADRLGGRLVGDGTGLVASFGLGTIFAIGWTPCIGTILGGILTLAATSGLDRPGRDPARRLHPRAGHPVPGDRPRLRPGAGDHPPAPAAWPCDVGRRRPARRRDRRGDAVRPAVADAALLPVPDRRLMAPERPEFQHRRERHGLIGPFSGRQLGAVLGIVALSAIVLVAVTRPLGTTAGTGPGDPRPTAYLLDVTEDRARDRQPGARAVGDPCRRDAVGADRRQRRPDPPGRPPRQGRLAQLLGELVPALPGRDADPARHLRRVQGPRARADRDQRPGDEPGRRRGVRRQVRARLHDRGRPVGRRLAPLPRLRAADPRVHRPRRPDPQDHRRSAQRRAGGRRGRGDPAAGVDRLPGRVAESLTVSAARTRSGRGRRRAGRPGGAARATARRSSPRRPPGRTARP